MMNVRARSKYVMDNRPVAKSGLTLFCTPGCVSSLWTCIVLAEKDVDNARVEWVRPGQPHQDLLVLNPQLDLPTLVDRDLVVHPAPVIAEYLDERFPHPKLMPPDPAARARLRMALLHVHQHLFPLLEQARKDKHPEARSARQALSDTLVRSHRLFPARGWFLGLEYNLVDCAWAAVFAQLPQLGLKPVGDSQPMAKYVERLLSRPSIKAALR